MNAYIVRIYHNWLFSGSPMPTQSAGQLWNHEWAVIAPDPMTAVQLVKQASGYSAGYAYEVTPVVVA